LDKVQRKKFGRIQVLH